MGNLNSSSSGESDSESELWYSEDERSGDSSSTEDPDTILRPKYRYHLPSERERERAEHTAAQKTKVLQEIDSVKLELETELKDMIANVKAQLARKKLHYKRKERRYHKAFEPAFRRLEEQRKKIEAEIAMEMAFIAPIKKLPVEVLSEIFFLAVENNGGLKRLLLVCRSWRRIAESTPRLWNNILLSTYTPYGENHTKIPFSKRCSTVSQLQRIVQRAANTHLDLAVHTFPKEEPEKAILRTLLPQCRRIAICGRAISELLANQEIPIHLPHLIKISIDGSMDEALIESFTTLAPRVQCLSLHWGQLEPWQGNFTQRLTHLALYRCGGPIDLDMLAHCISLQTLVLSELQLAPSMSKDTFPSLEELTLVKTGASTLLPLMDMPSLSILSITEDHRDHDQSLIEPSKRALAFPKLTTVQIEGDTAPLFLFDYHHLQLLSIDLSTCIVSSRAALLSQAVEALQEEHLRPITVHLSIDGHDRNVLVLLKSMPCVKTLRLTFTNHLPGKGLLRSLAAKPKKIGAPFAYCPNLTSLEAVIIGRSQAPGGYEPLFTPYLDARAAGGFPIEKFSCKWKFGC